MKSTTEFSLDEMKRALQRALDLLLEHDFHLLKADVNERAVAHKLAGYLEREFGGWHVDAEFNRNMGNVKQVVMPSSATKPKPVVPDIIVHHRQTNENLLAIEVKKAGRPGHEFDLQKLAAFTRPKPDGLGYCWGLHIVFTIGESSKEPEYKWFAKGRQI